MLVVQDAYSEIDLPRGGAAAIGNFDGVHRGQQALLEATLEHARGLEGPATVITFDPHPMAVLAPETAPPRLTTPGKKAELLEAGGVEALLVVRFTRELADTPAERFVRSFLHDKLGLEAVFVGSTFSFGRGREGNLELLRRMGGELGFAARGVPEVTYEGERISSTRIRRSLAAGEAEAAREMLGRPFAVTGQVVRGDRMGQRLGWPTINIEPDPELLLPADGVYAGRAVLEGYPMPFDCVTNIGTRPTVYENYQRVVESHILDFAADVYGQRVEVEFWKRLREERIFPSVVDLSVQIGRDVEGAREFFAVQRRLEESEVELGGMGRGESTE